MSASGEVPPGLSCSCAGVPVYPGDIIVADADGVVAVPRHTAVEFASESVEQTIRGLHPPNATARAKYAK